jgi:predicted site-specific integrase-resolvase
VNEAKLLPEKMSLAEAARRNNIDARTLRRWLLEECGQEYPRLGRGRIVLVKVADVEKAVAARSGRTVYRVTAENAA